MIFANKLGQEIDLGASVLVCRLVKAKNGKCWRNALRGLSRCYRSDDSAAYVEGWATGRFGAPLEHGWLEVGGRIVDPTPSWHPTLKVDQTARRLPCYYPVVRLTFGEIEGIPINRTPLPLIYRHPVARDHLKDYSQTLWQLLGSLK